MPLFFENAPIPMRVHGLPKSGVPVRGKFAVSGEAAQWLVLPYGCIAFNIVKGFGLDDKKAAIHPRSVWLLTKPADAGLFFSKAYYSKPAWRLRCSQGDKRVFPLMEVDQPLYVYVTYTIAVSTTKRFLADVLADAF